MQEGLFCTPKFFLYLNLMKNLKKSSEALKIIVSYVIAIANANLIKSNYNMKRF